MIARLLARLTGPDLVSIRRHRRALAALTPKGPR